LFVLQWNALKVGLHWMSGVMVSEITGAMLGLGGFL